MPAVLQCIITTLLNSFRSHSNDHLQVTGSATPALDAGFQMLLIIARQRSPMIRSLPAAPVTTDDKPTNDETPPRPEKKKIPPPPGPSRLTTVEERLLRLLAEFTQLTPDLLNTTTGLYQLKDSVGRLKWRLRARQARHSSQSLQQ